MKNEEHSSICSITQGEEPKEKMWSSTSTSSDLAKGKKFLEKLQYVQHVDKEKIPVCEISEQTLRDLLAGISKICHDSNSTENLENSEANLDILKSSLGDRIYFVGVCSNPLPISLVSSPTVAFHAFVVFATRNTTNSEKIMNWSLEKNGRSIVLQQSTNRDDVEKNLYDAEKGQSVKRYGKVKFKKWTMGNHTTLKYLLQVIWEYNQISDPYHLLYSNCQNFASFIFEKSNGGGEKWWTAVSSIFGRIRGREKKPAIEVNTILNKSFVKDDKFAYYKAMMEERMEDFKKLINNNLTMETLNSVDSQGYTLLEWATVFSSSDWPIDEELKKIGAEILPKAHRGVKIRSNKRFFRRNVFFIALQYLPPNKKTELFDSFERINIHGVNKTGDTSLHLALYGEKWKIAEEILPKLKNYDVNKTNSQGDTPLHLAAKLNCEFGLFKKILNRTNSENVNKTDGNGYTALHYAIEIKSKTKVRELLNRMDVNVNIKNNDNETGLHFASKWPTIPADLFQIILDQSTSDIINARNDFGFTPLYYAILEKSETAVKELLKHIDVRNNQNVLALHCACFCENFPMDLFKQIIEKTTAINAQDNDGKTALHWAIDKHNKTRGTVEELLKDARVDVNVKNNKNETALHFASNCKDIPMHLFKIILERTVDIDAQADNGRTALHIAIGEESDTKVKELLNHKDVDVNVKNNNNETALHLASKWKDMPMDLFKIILERSDDINEQDKDGWTALHYAINKRSKSKVEKLLNQENVDVNIKSNFNSTALHFASRWPTIRKHLFKIILEKTTDINAQDEDGDTALHYASFHSFLYDQEAIKLLLKDDRVDINVKNNQNRTALYYSLKWNTFVIDWLKKFQIESTDINATNEDGETVLRLNVLGKIIKIDVAKLITPSKNMWFKKRRIANIVIAFFLLPLSILFLSFLAYVLYVMMFIMYQKYTV